MAFEIDAMGAMDDAVENGVAQGGIANHLVPAIDRDLAGDQQGSPVVAIVDDFEQIAALLGLDLAIPDHSTLSRRAEILVLPRLRPDTAPVHLLVDSTGLRLCGPAEWLVEKHGSKRRRAWRKLHIGTDANTGQIVAAELTSHDIDDGSQVGSLLKQAARPVASFTGDGAYDRDDVYREVTERHPDAAVIVPPRSAAVPSAAAETTPTQRDRHLQLIAERGRMS